MSCCNPTGRSPYELYQGESRHWTLTVLDTSTQQPYSIQGAKAYMTIRGRKEEVYSLITKQNGAAGGDDSQILIRPSDVTDKGVADIWTVPADSNTIKPGDYWMDFWLVLVTGEHKVVIKDRPFKLKLSVGRISVNA